MPPMPPAYDSVKADGKADGKADANRVARKEPDTLFVGHNGTEPAKNIATLDFYYKQFGYLLGYIAAKMTESGKTGFSCACSSPTRRLTAPEERHRPQLFNINRDIPENSSPSVIPLC